MKEEIIPMNPPMIATTPSNRAGTAGSSSRSTTDITQTHQAIVYIAMGIIPAVRR